VVGPKRRNLTSSSPFQEVGVTTRCPVRRCDSGEWAEKTGEHPVERSGERLFGPGIVGRRPRGDGAGHSQGFHIVTNREALPHRFSGVLIPARIQNRDPQRHEQRGQRDVLCHHKISRLRMLGDVPIGDVGAAADTDGGHQGISRWRLQPLVRDQYGLDSKAPGGSKDEVLDVPWSGVCIDPDFQLQGSVGRWASRRWARSRGLVPSRSPVGLT
jgi:hypothetical protein